MVARISFQQRITSTQLRGNQRTSVAMLRLFTPPLCASAWRDYDSPNTHAQTHSGKVSCDPSAVIKNSASHSWSWNLKRPAVFRDIFEKQEGYLERGNSVLWLMWNWIQTLFSGSVFLIVANCDFLFFSGAGTRLMKKPQKDTWTSNDSYKRAFWWFKYK